MSTSESLALDLNELPAEPVAPAAGYELTLESMAAGQHGLTEVGASVIGPSVVLCSCCCCC